MQTLSDGFKVECIWSIRREDGTLKYPPFTNSITATGLAKTALDIASMSGVYLVIGDDTDPGETITEVYRKAVDSSNSDGANARFITQLLAGQGDGENHTKLCLFYEGTATPGSGTMYNLAVREWAKSALEILTVECKIVLSNA